MIRILLYLLMVLIPPANAHLTFNLNLEREYNDTYEAELDPYAPRGLRHAYVSSVVVHRVKDGLPQGLGSGNYFKLLKHRFVITAAHVVDGEAEFWIMEKGYQQTQADVIYLDTFNDIAILVPRERLKYTKALPFRRDINNQMGEKTYHCGHPAREGWHLSQGLLTGTHVDTLMVNTFVWPGSSGSVLFDENGRVLGVVTALRVDAPLGIPVMVEHLVLATNIKMLDQQLLRAVLENGG